MNWIKLTDKKPPVNTSVWIARLDYSIYDPLYSIVIDVAEYSSPNEHTEKSHEMGLVSGRFPYNDVTHWMPLTETTRHFSKIVLMQMYVEQLKEEKSE